MHCEVKLQGQFQTNSRHPDIFIYWSVQNIAVMKLIVTVSGGRDQQLVHWIPLATERLSSCLSILLSEGGFSHFDDLPAPGRSSCLRYSFVDAATVPVIYHRAKVARAVRAAGEEWVVGQI